MNYQMTPIGSGTRLRIVPTTFGAVLASYNRGQLVVGDELWEAPADGNEVKKGDKWLRVTSVDGVNVPERGWMAYIHKGVPICENFKETGELSAFPETVFLRVGSVEHEYRIVR